LDDIESLEPGRRRLLEEYGAASNYDREDTSATGIAFYPDLARETSGPVLELGCGTGRVAIPIAGLGYAVTGLDVVPAMLEQARRKPEGRGVRWVDGDARDFDLGERFRLIFLTGNTFQAFLTRQDQDALLGCAHRHLHDDGMLAFETRNPRWADSTGTARVSPAQADETGTFAFLETRGQEEPGIGYFDVNGNAVSVSRTQTYDHVTQVLQWTTYHRWMEGGQPRMRVGHVAVRFTFPQELEGLLHHNGFETVRRYGDWDLSPLTATSRSIIVVCRKATRDA
jgi:SAM-dependent methyltransferase